MHQFSPSPDYSSWSYNIMIPMVNCLPFQISCATANYLCFSGWSCYTSIVIFDILCRLHCHLHTLTEVASNSIFGQKFLLFLHKVKTMAPWQLPKNSAWTPKYQQIFASWYPTPGMSSIVIILLPEIHCCKPWRCQWEEDSEADIVRISQFSSLLLAQWN